MLYLCALISFFLYKWFHDELLKRNRINADNTERNRINTDNTAVLYFIAIVLIAISACRYQDYHSDYLTNYNHMIRMNSVPWSNILQEDNIGHAIFRKIIITIFKDPQWYFGFSSALIITSFVKVVKSYSCDYYLIAIMFYTIGYYFTGNNTTRQAIAVAITMVSWKYIFKRNLIKFLCVVFVAISFHSSAIFFIPMYFIAKIKISKKIIYLYLVLGGVILILQKYIITIFQKFIYSDYSGESYGTVGSNPMRLLLVLMIIVYFIGMINNVQETSDLIKKKSESNSELLLNFISHSTFIYIILSFLSVFSSLMFSRLSMYWDIPMLISLEYSVNVCKKGKKNGYRSLLIIGCLTWFLLMDCLGKLCPTPYTPFWLFPSRSNI